MYFHNFPLLLLFVFCFEKDVSTFRVDFSIIIELLINETATLEINYIQIDWPRSFFKIVIQKKKHSFSLCFFFFFCRNIGNAVVFMEAAVKILADEKRDPSLEPFVK